MFQIDVLYKKIPLPNHYTLIDIAYIYSWKGVRRVAVFQLTFARVTVVLLQNEPMKFFFRITDKKVVSQRFDHLDNRTYPEIFVKPTKAPRKTATKLREKKKKDAANAARGEDRREGDVPPEGDISSIVNHDEIKSKFKEEETRSGNDAAYANITLNRDDDVEIIAKVQKVSNKNGQPIGLNIIKQTVKKTPRVDVVKEAKGASYEEGATQRGEDAVESCERYETGAVQVEANVAGDDVDDARTRAEMEEAKSNFFRSIELAAKCDNAGCSGPSADAPKTLGSAKKSAQRRKNTSPIKNERPAKKAKLDKKAGVRTPANPKTIPNPDVRQIVDNVKSSADCVSKLVEQTAQRNAAENTDLKSLFNSCKINIPSSLSITLKEGRDDDCDKFSPVSMKPVQNYIEILKLPDVSNDQKTEHAIENLRNQGTAVTIHAEGESARMHAKVPESHDLSVTISKAPPPAETLLKVVNVPQNAKSQAKDSSQPKPSFQKMFEEAVKLQSASSRFNFEKSNSDKLPIDLSTAGAGAASSPHQASAVSKRNLFEITSQLHKKSKLEVERKLRDGGGGDGDGDDDKHPVKSVKFTTSSHLVKVAIPRLYTQKQQERNVQAPVPDLHRSRGDATAGKDLSPDSQKRFLQTSANLHSASLGMNYTVSVTQNGPGSLASRDVKMGKNQIARIPSVATPNKFQMKPLTVPVPGHQIPNETRAGLEKFLKIDDTQSNSKQRNETPIQNADAQKETSSVHASTSYFCEDLRHQLLMSTYDFKQSQSSSKKHSPRSKSSNALLPGSNAVTSPKLNASPKSATSPKTSTSPKPSTSPGHNVSSSNVSPRPGASPKVTSPKSTTSLRPCHSPGTHHGKQPKPRTTPDTAPSPRSSKTSPKTAQFSPNGSKCKSNQMTSNQIQEKYKLQNLAQLTASFNFNPPMFGMTTSPQVAAFKQAMLFKQLEMHNRQQQQQQHQQQQQQQLDAHGWMNARSNDLIQYEKYIQTLAQTKNRLSSKEN